MAGCADHAAGPRGDARARVQVGQECKTLCAHEAIACLGVPACHRNRASMFIRLSVLLLLASVIEVSAQIAPVPTATQSASFDSVVTRAVSLFRPTGLAVAVVRDGQVQYLGARGESRHGGGNAVTPSTPFAIASMTKAFTGTALALLVQEGKVRWDDPVVRYLPSFAMADPYVSARMTVRDLLVHRSGLALGAGDLLTWPDSRWTPDDILKALPHLPLDHGFRERFVYDNTLYIVAGEVVRAASGVPWATFVQQRILAPLGMRDCAPAPDGRPMAAQHSGGAGNARPLTVTIWHPDPAGSIICSAADLARWGQLHASLGLIPDGTRLIDEAVLREVHTPVTFMRPSGIDRRLGATHLQGYALGWIAGDFLGRLALWHGGAAPGGTTEMIVLPELRAAVVVLVNDQTPMALPLARQLADLLVRQGDAADWLGDVAARLQRQAAPGTVAQASPEAAGEVALPAATLARHAGRYRDPWYGNITITVKADGSLELHLTRSAMLRGRLIPLGGVRFLARWPERSLNADAIVTFDYAPSGEPIGFTMKAASPETDFSYDFHHLRAARASSK